jgi:hypothetical protein
LNIHTPHNFNHAGELSGKYASVDPRASDFYQQNVDIDMRQTQFVRPAAVLWCAVYPLLASGRGSKCRLLVPENKGTCVYLKSVGLFSLLQERGVDVDDRGIYLKKDTQLVLPLTGFSTEFEVEQLANDALDALTATGLGSANIHPLVSEVFAELALNAVQHSESSIGAFGFVQFYESQFGRRFVCAVADGGIGIRRSLERNPALRQRVAYDWDAIELALRERVSGTGVATRGIGLYGVAEDMRKPGRQLIIHSGIGLLETSEQVESSSRRTALFPGTLAYASIDA